MSFASPIWWWALAGLALPLAIHLLSRGRRLRIVIGSIRHLQGAQSRALRRLRLSGWLQLLLRMLVLTALALALAGARWPLAEERSEAGAWVLIDPELQAIGARSPVAKGEFWRRMEAAKQTASSIRLLAPGFPELSSRLESSGYFDAWSLLREADEIAPASSSLTVFTLDRKAWLQGRRPSFSRQVNWWVLADPEPNRWIQRAVSTADGLLVATVGESRSDLTRFSSYSWSEREPPPVDSGIRVNTDRGILELRLSDPLSEDDSVPLPENPGSIRLALKEGPDRKTDAMYLRRASETVGRYLGRELEWVDGDMSQVNLEIRLGTVSSAGSPASVVLRDGDAAFENCKAMVYAESISADPWVLLDRCSTGWETDGEVGWWLDEWGRPFLSRRQIPTAVVYRLQGRFDSRWSRLVTSSVLPRLLVGLIAPGNASLGGAGTPGSDRRETTGMERMPGRKQISTGASSRDSDAPESLAWVLVALLLGVERWVSGRIP